MLKLYIKKHNLPKDEIFIQDPESIAYRIRLDPSDKFIVLALKEIEKAVVFTETAFTDRFGHNLVIDNLSTTTKILLLSHMTDYIINAVELGSNAFPILNALDGKLYFNAIYTGDEFLEAPIMINENLCTNKTEIGDNIDVD